MKFLYHKNADLPLLSWCAELEKGLSSIHIYHGVNLEVNNRFFVEGSWETEFYEGNFDLAESFMGSGGKILDKKVLFATPSHVLERIFVIIKKDKLYVSPSLAFVLQSSSSNLDINYIPYQVDLFNMITKVSNNVGLIPLDNGKNIYVFHYRNIIINPNFDIQVDLKKETPEFPDFISYKKFIIQTMINLKRNAISSERKIKYRALMSPLSSGYDSPASTILSMECGLDQSVTFRNARKETVEVDDSGKEISEILNIQIKEYERLDVKDKTGLPEAEFVATGDLGQDLIFSVFEHEFRNKIVVTGFHGDVVWDSNKKYDQNDIRRGDPSGGSLLDFKFRVGFIHVPLPFIGCYKYPSINRISNSEEMKSWRTFNKYDRPIARRIVEEKGIERKMFGQYKKAVTVLLNDNNTLLYKMNPNSAVSFESFYKEHHLSRDKLKQFYFNFMFKLYKIIFQIISIPNRLLRRINLSYSIPIIFPKKYTQCPNRPSYLLHWGLSIIRDRYKQKFK